MRLIAHLSDLHFGRVDPAVVDPLLESVWQARPHLTVVSGDFVQNGTPKEFAAAREFLLKLPEPRLIVPGNHDMPFANWWKRATIGLGYFREYLSNDLEPVFIDDEIAVMGITTARRLHLRGGRISEEQIRRIEEKLSTFGDRLKVLVSHHPFDLDESYHRRELVGRARVAMGRFAQRIDVLLAGHMHLSHAGHTAVRYKIEGQSAIFVQAGTATSTRGRGEPNTFNLIRWSKPSLVVERNQWQPFRSKFEPVCTDEFDLSHEPPAQPKPEIPAEQEVAVLYPE
jgi:3',5'-cyclic AMP phosphodiesterase CpdA